jgi:hypothetical protein
MKLRSQEGWTEPQIAALRTGASAGLRANSGVRGVVGEAEARRGRSERRNVVQSMVAGAVSECGIRKESDVELRKLIVQWVVDERWVVRRILY